MWHTQSEIVAVQGSGQRWAKGRTIVVPWLEYNPSEKRGKKTVQGKVVVRSVFRPVATKIPLPFPGLPLSRVPLSRTQCVAHGLKNNGLAVEGGETPSKLEKRQA
jgi:hypothetical protein